MKSRRSPRPWRGARAALAGTLALASLLLVLPLGCDGDGGGGGPAADAGPDNSAPVDAQSPDGGTLPDGGASPDAGARDSHGAHGGLFAFGLDPAQPISAAPFPNDLYLGADGLVRIASLVDDPVFGGRAKPAQLERYRAIANTRTGFGSTSAVWFFAAEAVDEASLADRVRIVSLAGPDAGREVAAQAFWSDQAGAVGVFHAWGDYLVAGSTYAALLTRGVATAAGDEVAPAPAVAALLAQGPPAGDGAALWEAWAPLRAWLAEEGLATEDVVVATVFTTQAPLPFARAVYDAVASAPLTAPTRRVRWDPAAETFEEAPPIEGADLDALYGTPLPPFEHNPGLWLGSRGAAAELPGQDGPYEGGTGHVGVGRVLNGSFVAPAFNMAAEDGTLRNVPLRYEGGRPVAALEAVVPFTLWLCEDHLADPSDLPVAVFSHGGGAIRADASAYAVAHCRAGIATIAIDMVFHGGRLKTALLADEGLVVPTADDVENAFSGRSEGDDGYLRDWIGDDAAAVASVAPLFAVGVDADPDVMEANLMTISADTATLLRLLREGDWSAVQEGLSFDPARIVHSSISFGTSFHTALLALDDGLAAAFGSVASGEILTVNLLMAPVNATQAAAVLSSVVGLKTPLGDLPVWSLDDPVLSLLQWLHERGDPMVYAPYVLRHRLSDRLPPVLHSGDSWDETLYGPAQISYQNALGLGMYTHGAEWTVDPSLPGAERVAATPAPAGGIQDNVTYGGRTTTAAMFWRNASCHGQAHTAVCRASFVRPYPPIRLLDTPEVSASPLCAIQSQYVPFLAAAIGGDPVTIGPPEGTCAALYGP